MDWITVVQDRDRWWALVNAVMNLRIPKKKKYMGISWLAEYRLASREGLCSIEVVNWTTLCISVYVMGSFISVMYLYFE